MFLQSVRLAVERFLSEPRQPDVRQRFRSDLRCRRRQKDAFGRCRSGHVSPQADSTVRGNRDARKELKILSVSPSAPGPSGACQASYRTVDSWQGGFQGEVSVTAGGSAINGWTVRWTLAGGQNVTQVWSGTLTTSGSTVTVRNASFNGSLPASGSTTFGFLASGTPSTPALNCVSP
jgi:hypothetical protein